MEQFTNLETKLIAKWFGNKIDILVDEHPDMSVSDLQCLVSETIENLIKEQLLDIPEGYVSELIGESFGKIDYQELVKYFRQLM